MSVQFQKWYFNVEDYYRMAEAGLFSEDDRVELIEGEIIKMSPIGSRHAGCVDRLNSILSRKVGHAAIIRVQRREIPEGSTAETRQVTGVVNYHGPFAEC
jgi:hypothetical protein